MQACDCDGGIGGSIVACASRKGKHHRGNGNQDHQNGHGAKREPSGKVTRVRKDTPEVKVPKD